jgi:hypothetical protein
MRTPQDIHHFQVDSAVAHLLLVLGDLEALITSLASCHTFLILLLPLGIPALDRNTTGNLAYGYVHQLFVNTKIDIL